MVRFGGAWISSGLVVAVLSSWGCAAHKNDVRLEMQREVEVLEPNVVGIQATPSGRVDTRDNGTDVRVTMTSDPGLVATFDVPGRVSGQPMKEGSPGVYSGSFHVDKGQTGDVKVVGHVNHPPSGAHKTYDAGTLLTLWTSPHDHDEGTVEQPPVVDSCADLDAKLTNAVFLFDFDDVELNQDELRRIDELKGVILGAPTCRIFVLGHTDLIGEEDYNDRLSQSRADHVVQHMTEAGVPAARLEAHGYGKSHPVTQERGLTAQAPNRRVEIRAMNPYAS